MCIMYMCYVYACIIFSQVIIITIHNIINTQYMDKTDQKNEFLLFIRRFDEDLALVIKSNNLGPNFSRFSGEHFDANPNLLNELNDLYNRVAEWENRLERIKFATGDPWCDTFMKDFTSMKQKIKELVPVHKLEELVRKKNVNQSIIRMSTNNGQQEEQRKRKQVLDDINKTHNLLQTKGSDNQTWHSQVTPPPPNWCKIISSIFIIIVLLLVLAWFIVRKFETEDIAKDVFQVFQSIIQLIRKPEPNSQL